MPFVQRSIEPKFLSRTTLWLEDGKPKVEDQELEAVTNNTLSNALRQLASLLLVAEDIFSVLGDQLKDINRRSEILKTRITKVDRKVADFDPKKVSVRLILAVVEGAGITWSSPILKKLNGVDDNPLGRIISSDESSFLASLPVLGSSVGAFIIVGVSYKMGRKPSLIVFGIPALICYLTLAFSSNIWFYYFARVISGINSAVTNILIPMYICEIADSGSRGTLAAGGIISINLGILISFSAGPYVPFFWYHVGLSFLPITFMILFSIFGLESPYYYLQSDPSKAEELLKQLNGVENVKETFDEMRRSSQKTPEGNVLDLIKMKGPRRALLVGLGLVTFTIGSGANILIAYAQLIFDLAGGSLSGEIDNIIVGVVQLAVSVVASSIMDKFERKHFLASSSVLIGLFIGILSIFLIFKDSGANVGSLGWVPLVCFLGFAITYNIGLGPLWSTVLGELFPLNVKSAGMSVCGLWTAILGFVLTLVFQRVQQWIGLGGTLLFFAIMSITGAVFVMVFIMEMKGKTLEQIQIDLCNASEKKIIHEKS